MTQTTPDAATASLVTAAFIRLLAQSAVMPTMEVQQQTLLLVLYDKGELDQRDLVNFTHVSTSSNNRNIALLGNGARPIKRSDGEIRERRPGLGWVESYRDPKDNRYTKVRLTPLGRAELDRIALKVAQLLQISRHGQ